MRKTYHTQRGFTVLLTVIIMTIMIGITTSISSVVTREVKLSNTGRHSVSAHYAAETGLECAVYWIVQDSNLFGGGADLNEECVGDSISLDSGSFGGDSTISVDEYDYQFQLDLGTAGCAQVRIDTDTRKIRSDGFDPCPKANAQVQRSLIGSY